MSDAIMDKILRNKGDSDMARQLTIEAKIRKAKYDAEYDSGHTTRLYIKLNNSTDADILAYLSTLPNKQGTIKTLVRQQMEQEGFVYTPEDTTWETPDTP
jgi:hypothetical protein